MSLAKEYDQRLSQSRARWKPATRAEKVAQLVGVAAGYTTARICRQIGAEAAAHIDALYAPHKDDAS